MMQETKDLVSSINAGEHSQEVMDFAKSAVDHVAATCGESEDVAVVNEALDRRVRKFLDEHPGCGCAVTNKGRIIEMGRLRPIGKFTDL
jgi:hypothetical protein